MLPQAWIAPSREIVLHTAMDRDGVIEPLYELDFDEEPRDFRAAPPEADRLDDIALVDGERRGAAPPAIAGAIEIDPVHPLRRLGSWVDHCIGAT